MPLVFYPHDDYNDGSLTEHEYALGIGYSTPSGLFGHPADAAPVYISGGQAYVRAGVVGRMLGMAWMVVDEDEPITIASNSGGSAARLDHVVARLSWSTMQITLEVKQGTVGGSLPGATRQRGSGVFEQPLSQVALAAGGTVAGATVTRTCWYIGSDGQYRAGRAALMPNEAGRTAWEHETGRYVVGSGSQWFVLGDNASATLSLATANWSAPVFNRLRKRNGWASLAISPMRVSGPLNAGQTSRLGTIPAGFRPMDDMELVGHVVSTGAQVVGLITAATGHIDLTFWRFGIGTNRFCNLQAVSWPVAY